MRLMESFYKWEDKSTYRTFHRRFKTDVAIGDIDNCVIKLVKGLYIPGSSLKGKIRSS